MWGRSPLLLSTTSSMSKNCAVGMRCDAKSSLPHLPAAKCQLASRSFGGFLEASCACKSSTLQRDDMARLEMCLVAIAAATVSMAVFYSKIDFRIYINLLKAYVVTSDPVGGRKGCQNQPCIQNARNSVSSIAVAAGCTFATTPTNRFVDKQRQARIVALVCSCTNSLGFQI